MGGVLVGVLFGIGVLLVWSAFWEPMDLSLVGVSRGVDRDVKLPAGLTPVPVLVGVGVGVVGSLVTGSLVWFTLIGTAIVVMPPLLRGSQSEMRFAAETDAVAGWVENLRDLMRGQHGIEGALRESISSVGEELRSPVRHLHLRQEAGVALPEALVLLADEVENPVMDVVVTAMLTNLETMSSEMGRVLDEVAERAREMAKDHRQISLSRQQSRSQLRLIAQFVAVGLPLVGLALGDVVAPLTDGAGRLVVVGTIVWCGAMLLWMAHLSGVEEMPRVLRPGGIIEAGATR